MKKQVVVIHGGDTFADDQYDQYLASLQKMQIDFDRLTSDKSDWKRGLRKMLGEDYEVMLPSMPNKTNARYIEWKIWFEKIIPYMRDGVILIGHSMGGAFLAKYLTENHFPRIIKAVFLVAAVYDKDKDGNPLHTFALPEALKIPTDKIYLYHSQDDPVVPIGDLALYRKQFPNAVERVFGDRGHFNMAELPEIADDIKRNIYEN